MFILWQNSYPSFIIRTDEKLTEEVSSFLEVLPNSQYLIFEVIKKNNLNQDGAALLNTDNFIPIQRTTYAPYGNSFSHAQWTAALHLKGICEDQFTKTRKDLCLSLTGKWLMVRSENQEKLRLKH